MTRKWMYGLVLVFFLAASGTVTIHALPALNLIPFSESFTGGAPPALPGAWTQQAVGAGITNDRWTLSASANAGGAANEAKCTYPNFSPSPGTLRLISPPIITTGFSTLRLRFKHSLNYFAGASVQLRILTSPDKVTWTPESWSRTTSASIAAETVTMSLANNLDSPTTYVAFEISGTDLYDFNYWYIDDIFIDYLALFVPSGSWTGAGCGTLGWFLGDFNGDGKTDIFRYLPGVSGADVFLSDGTKFNSAGSWTGAGCGTYGWSVGDFNGDGKTDIFRYLPGFSGADVFLSDGTKFNYAGSWTDAGCGTEGWYVGDFNGDGKTDIFRVLPGVSGADVFLSDGTKFVYLYSWTGADSGADGWYMGDFNGDGKTDIFRYVPGESGAEVFLSNGSSFVNTGSWTGAGHGTLGWYVGDFNGDHKADIFRYLPGVSGAEVLLSTSTSVMGSSAANLSPENLTALDDDMMMDVQGTRTNAPDLQMQKAFLVPFVQMMMAGEKVPVVEIQNAFAEVLGSHVRRPVILRLIEQIKQEMR